jgi:pyridoxamine 5'-phosphate oxidase
MDDSARMAGDGRGRSLPGFYNDLDGSLAHAWAMIGRGVADRRFAFHTPVVATVDQAGGPCQRVMVLRAADGAARSLRLHTDARSEKLAHIAEQPRISLAFYDVGEKLQLRVGGHARVHQRDETAREAWLQSRPQSRLCYEQPVAPGASVDKPLPELPVDARFATSDDGQQNFAVLMVIVDTIEWLYLAIEGHRRARWAWHGDRWQGTWLAP